MINYGNHFVDKEDLKKITKPLSEKYLTSGKYLNLFENKIKNYFKCRYVIACSSGTSAIFLAMKSLNLKKNDIIIMPIINFVASANIANLLGCKIYFADVHEKTGQMTPETLKNCIKDNKLKKISVVLTMYMAGHPYNISEFYKLKNKYKFTLIEDACHAFGSQYKINSLHKIGSCKHSDIATFSFHPLKTITTGEGGCLTTNNYKIFQMAKNLRNHGFDSSYKKAHWQYDLIKSSLNFRLSELNCALGVSQIKKVNFFLKKRSDLANNYFKLFRKIKLKKYIELPQFDKLKFKSSWHLFLINIDFTKFNTKKELLMNHLFKKGLKVQYHYTPINQFRIFKVPNTVFRGAKNYKRSTISIPIFVALNKSNQIKVVKLINNFLKKKLIK